MGGVTVLTALAKVNQAVDTGNGGLVYQALQVIFISIPMLLVFIVYKTIDI